MIPVLPIAGALLGAGGGYLSARAKNKKLKGVSDAFAPYTGYTPPRTQYLRPVEDLITQTTMRRSQGQDVGYDPGRREALLKDYDIEQGRSLDLQKRDLTNRLSGMGLSRNAAAYDELVGRALRQAEQEKNLYRNRVDIEDLARRSEERDINTGRLQNLNTFNFGQENQVADFERAIWEGETGNEARRRSLQLGVADRYQDPWASALAGGVEGANIGAGLSGTMSKPPTAREFDPRYDVLSGRGVGYRKDMENRYLDPALRNRGYNLQR